MKVRVNDEKGRSTQFHMLERSFFNLDSPALARALIGKVLRRRWKGQWLSARIIETEAYRLDEKGSHASLGYTHKRRALFMDGGTIYMYYSRGGDSFNISAAGPGNAVLIKSAYPWIDSIAGPAALAIIQTTRLGITAGRDEHLPYRFVDPAYARFSTRNPLRRGQTIPEHYCWIDSSGNLMADQSFPVGIVPIAE
jgi:DNA-3-methyladenine glycosylase